MVSKVFVVVPAYNEERAIVNVLKGLKSENYNNVVVINDGSKDLTKELVKNEDVEVISHMVNRGQGAALKTGIRHALGQGADVIVTFDSDGQHNPKDIVKLLDKLSEGYDIVLGSRFLGEHKVPLIRKLFLKGGAISFRLFYGVNLSDSHNGLRAFTKDAAKLIDIKQEGMAHASEIIDRISKNKLKYCEVPVDIRYTDYSLEKGQKTSNAFKILFHMVLKKLLD